MKSFGSKTACIYLYMYWYIFIFSDILENLLKTAHIMRNLSSLQNICSRVIKKGSRMQTEKWNILIFLLLQSYNKWSSIACPHLVFHFVSVRSSVVWISLDGISIYCCQVVGWGEDLIDSIEDMSPSQIIQVVDKICSTYLQSYRVMLPGCILQNAFLYDNSHPCKPQYSALIFPNKQK